MGLFLLVLDCAEFFRQPPVEAFVQPAEKFSRADIAGRHRWQPGFHLRLNFHVSDMLNLKRALSRVRGKILSNRRVDVSRPRAMSFDEVRVIAVHRAHQIRHHLPGDRVQRSTESFGTPDDCQGLTRRFAFTVARQERLHVRWVIVKHFDGSFSSHLCRYYCRSTKPHKSLNCK